jgi:hypothetical protein
LSSKKTLAPQDGEGNERPRELEGERAVDLLGAIVVRASTVPDPEVEERDPDPHREQAGNAEDEEEEGVHLPGEGGCLFG